MTELVASNPHSEFATLGVYFGPIIYIHFFFNLYVLILCKNDDASIFGNPDDSS